MTFEVEGVCNIKERKRVSSHVALGLLQWKMVEIGISCGVGILSYLEYIG
jgi:hypothetical protein